MSFLVSTLKQLRPAGLKLGLRTPRRARDEFAGLDRLDRPELDDDDTRDTGTTTDREEREPPSRKVA
jgi:hypothetical protein